MAARTRSERNRYEEARRRGTMGKEVVYGSRPATEAQLRAIRAMYRRAGYRYESEAIKAVLGKVPINGLNRERASMVIQHLQERIEARKSM